MSRFCPQCGTPRQQEAQKFCSTCGNALPRTPTQPQAPAQAAASIPAPAAAVPQTAPVVEALAHTSPSPKRRSSLPMLLGVGGVALAAVGAAAFVGWQALGPQGGADSPEAAVAGLVDAVGAQDGVAALGLINPGEAAGLADVYTSAHDRLVSEGIITGAGISESMDVELTGMEYDVDHVAENVARVDLTGGTATVTFDRNKLPDRIPVDPERPAKQSWSDDIIEAEGDDWLNTESGPFLMTVRRDGRWYVSLLATYGETRFLNAEPGYRPDWDALDEEPLEPELADDPEQALEALVDAASSEDVEALLATLPEDQGWVLRAFAAPFERALRDESVDFDLSVTELDTDVAENGEKVRLTIDDLVIDATVSTPDGVDSGRLEVRGRCAVAAEYDDYDGDYDYSDELCLDGGISEQAGLKDWALVLTRRDGGWQVDPMATLADYAHTLIEQATDELIDDAIAAACEEVDYQPGC